MLMYHARKGEHVMSSNPEGDREHRSSRWFEQDQRGILPIAGPPLVECGVVLAPKLVT